MKEIYIKMAQVLEKINHKISTQFKLLEFAEKEPGRLITRNKKGGIEKLREFRYSSPKVFMDYA